MFAVCALVEANFIFSAEDDKLEFNGVILKLKTKSSLVENYN